MGFWKKLLGVPDLPKAENRLASGRPSQLEFAPLSEKQILEKLQRLQQDHFKARRLRKKESIDNFIDHFIPKLVAIKPQDSDRIFSTYVNSLRGPTRLRLHARKSIDDSEKIWTQYSKITLCTLMITIVSLSPLTIALRLSPPTTRAAPTVGC
jgi:hypothetical protein